MRAIRFHQKVKYLNNLGSRMKKKEKGEESLFKQIIGVNFPNLEKDLDIHVYETNRIPYQFNVKKTCPRHIIIKLKN